MVENKGYLIKNRVINGGEVKLPVHSNYAKVYLDILKQYNDKIALIDGISGEKTTYRKFIQRTLNIAASLKNVGVNKGDVVAICSENRIEYMLTVFAVIYIGAVANFINSAYCKDEIIHTLEISKPKYIFFSPTTYEKYYEIVKNLGFISEYFIFGKTTKDVKAVSFQDLVRGNVGIDELKAADVDGSNTAIIVYSSGTTGLPKGVKWLHIGLIVACMQPICTNQDLTVLTIAPWTNTVGFMLSMQYILSGKTTVFLSKFTEKVYFETIKKYKVGFLLTVPPLIILLSKSSILTNYDISSVKYCLCGGAVLESKVIAEAKKRIPSLQYIFNGYGMSEATGALTMENEHANKLGSVGKVIPGIIVKVVDVDTRKVLGPNEPGEVCLKGVALFGGYIGKPPGDDYDEEGFYKTGDIAYYDSEGYFYIVDRIKELIKYKSWQVAPSELEAVLLQHPAVKDVAVIGVPDSLAGELPMAFIVKQQAANVTDKEIVEFVAAKVSPWKYLRGGVRFIDEIPKNGSGKILRRELKKLIKPQSKL